MTLPMMPVIRLVLLGIAGALATARLAVEVRRRMTPPEPVDEPDEMAGVQVDVRLAHPEPNADVGRWIAQNLAEFQRRGGRVDPIGGM